MTRYKQAEFADDDLSSVGSVQLTGGVSASATHIRYHAGSTLWRRRTQLEKSLLLLTATLLFIVFILIILLSVAGSKEKVFPQLEPFSSKFIR